MLLHNAESPYGCLTYSGTCGRVQFVPPANVLAAVYVYGPGRAALNCGGLDSASADGRRWERGSGRVVSD